MTLDEKLGQMTQAERGGIDADTAQITDLGLGSVLSGGGSVPDPNTPEAWADMVDRYQRAAMATRLHIPLLYGVDSVHGDGNLYGATVFPHNIGLGATRDPQLVREAAHVTAMETRATGPQWTFAPCLCVARDDRWGRTYESFGETPQLVESMETAIDGFQGRPGQLKNNDRVLATAKHFAGDGLTTYGTGSNSGQTGNYPIDQGVDQVNRATFDRLALAPYVPAVKKHHVGSVMPSYSDVDWLGDGLGNPINMHGNRSLITGWLKQKQGFDGLVISDYEGIHHIDPGSSYEHQVEVGVKAGIDLFMEPYDYATFISTLKGLVQNGTIDMHRIDDAVSRVLRAKFELGLFEHPYTDRTHLDEVGSPAHRAVARKAVQESQVLLKNDHHALPIRGHRPIYVAGSNADNIGNQAGGWTLTWQGGSTNVIPGTTILDAIKDDSSDVTFSEDASAPVPHGAIGVVVVGETPYAEGFGDVGGPRWAYDPGDNGQPRPGEDDEAVRRRHHGRQHGMPQGGDLRRPRRLGTADDHPALPAEEHRRARRILAARQRGRGGRRRPLRQGALHRTAPGHLAALGGPGADQHRRRALQPGVPLRLGPADPWRSRRRPGSPRLTELVGCGADATHLHPPCTRRTTPHRHEGRRCEPSTATSLRSPTLVPIYGSCA